MQNEFHSPGGKFYRSRSSEIISEIRKLCNSARRSGSPIIYVQDTQTKRGKQSNDVKRNGPHCLTGTWGWKIIDKLKPMKGDQIVLKREYSAFFQTNLTSILKRLRCNRIVVTGATTNCCVRATVQDGFELGFDVIVPKDCVQAPSELEHRSALLDVELHFGEVSTARSVISKYFARKS